MFGNIRRNTVVFIAVCLTVLLFITGCRSTSSAGKQEIVVRIESMDSFSKFGNIKLKIQTREFMETIGFEYGDAVRVRFLDKDMVLPLVSTFSLLDVGETGICAEETDQSGQFKEIILFINLADFTTRNGIAHKIIDQSGRWYWTLNEGIELPIEVTLSLEEKNAFPEYAEKPLAIATSRSDYPHLSDAEFGNIRMVTTPGFGNCFYRGSSPIDSTFNRNTIVDAAISEIGIEISINLADSQTVAEKTKGFSDTYYSKTSILFNEMGVDYRQESFKNGLKIGFKYIADNEGVYYVHCALGKDRTGIFCAVLEALMGASAEQVIEDYMKTYVLYYGLQKGSLYDKIADTNICNALEELFALDSEFRDVTTEQLTQAAYGFIKSIGLSDSEIASLKTNLSRVRTEADCK